MSELLDKWYCYDTVPIDFWDGWQPLSTLVTRLVGLEVAGVESIPVQDLLTLSYESAYAVSKQLQYSSKISRTGLPVSIWEGDIRGDDLYVAYFDGEAPKSLHEVIFGWKQDNNGTTFIASQIPLDVEEFRDSCDAPQFTRSKLGLT